MRLLLLIILLSLLNCVSTKEGHKSGDTRIPYYEQNSPDNNTVYFNNVRDHFEKIGRQLEHDEELEYKSAVFISSLPPIADVYLDGIHVGKTNVEILYVKPGKHVVAFKKGEYENSFEFTFLEGPNPSQLVRLLKKE